MFVFVFGIDGSHLSIKHKTSDLFCVKRYSALSTEPFLLIFGIFLNMWTCFTTFSSQVKCYTNIFNWISFCGVIGEFNVLC